MTPVFFVTPGLLLKCPLVCVCAGCSLTEEEPPCMLAHSDICLFATSFPRGSEVDANLRQQSAKKTNLRVKIVVGYPKDLPQLLAGNLIFFR